MNFKDHFSGHASLYRDARPHYPAALFDWIAAHARARECVWDAGCGNGQASIALAEHFTRVIATDPSAQQLGNATPHPRIEYRVEPAERTSLADRSVDAITVAQALHWFDLAAFVQEVRRVAVPGALFAAWAYAGCSVDARVDAVIARLYEGTLGAYWPPERALVDEGYASLALPFAPLQPPPFEMRMDWTDAQLLAYLQSWSAAQRYHAATGRDAITEIADPLRRAWGDPGTTRSVRWKLMLRAGRLC